MKNKHNHSFCLALWIHISGLLIPDLSQSGQSAPVYTKL